MFPSRQGGQFLSPCLPFNGSSKRRDFFHTKKSYNFRESQENHFCITSFWAWLWKSKEVFNGKQHAQEESQDAFDKTTDYLSDAKDNLSKVKDKAKEGINAAGEAVQKAYEKAKK